jgi:hypothetical protein
VSLLRRASFVLIVLLVFVTVALVQGCKSGSGASKPGDPSKVIKASAPLPGAAEAGGKSPPGRPAGCGGGAGGTAPAAKTAVPGGKGG